MSLKFKLKRGLTSTQLFFATFITAFLMSTKAKMEAREGILFGIMAAVIFAFFYFIMPYAGTNPIMLFIVFMVLAVVVWLLFQFVMSQKKT